MTWEKLDARLAGYLRTNRAFTAPAVAGAVAALGIPEGGRVLDAGTGAGGALPALAHAAGPQGGVLALDLNSDIAALAAEHAREAGAADTVTVRTGDLTEVLAASEGEFDAVWAGDLIWPGNFADPAETVRRMAGALRPGGVLGLFYSNYYQALFLPGHSRLQRLLRAASELRWGLPADGEHHYERHLAWLIAAGLEQVELHLLPRSAFPIDADPTVRPYLEEAVWPELLESAESRGAEAGMSPQDLEQARELLTPGRPGYLADQPGFFVSHPMVLACGRRAA